MKLAQKVAVLWCAVQLGFPAAVTEEASRSAAEKLRRIEDGELTSGETVVLLEAELNAYLQYAGAGRFPAGVRDPSLQLRAGGAIVQAVIDLEQAGASLEQLPMVMRLLLRGTRSVAVDVDYQASDGSLAVRPVSFKVEDFAMEGAELKWFLEAFAPPEWQPYLGGERIELQDGVRDIRVEPGRAVIVAD